LGGFWQDRVGPRKVAILGIGLWGCGNLLAGLGTAAFGAPWLYLTYGVIGGVGAGMAYVAPLPDARPMRDTSWMSGKATCRLPAPCFMPMALEAA